MGDVASFENWRVLRSFLGRQLWEGRLALILGAGVSFGFGLPTWRELTRRAYNGVNEPFDDSWTNEGAAERLLVKSLGNDRRRFAQTIRNALYDGLEPSFANITENKLMRALGALMMASMRGNVSSVISYNFDDLLERYLSYHGFAVRSVASHPVWAGRADVTVFHPHGLLPSPPQSDEGTPLIYTKMDFDRRAGHEGDWWNQIVSDIMASHTCLFVGLSGADDSVRRALTSAHDVHPGRPADAYWGVRFAKDRTGELAEQWEYRRVFIRQVSDYENELPALLLEICQSASELTP